MTDTNTTKSYERIVIKDNDGNAKVEWERPMFGDLTMKTEGGKTVIEKSGLFGSTTTYMPSDAESVEAKS
jgi:hypothetical protein